jgi:hypothetical protein
MVSTVVVCMYISVSDGTYYTQEKSQSELLTKIRTTVIFSVLATIMQKLNSLYRPIDIIAVTLSIHFISTTVHSIVLRDQNIRRRLHCGYILRSISRQSILVVSDAVAHTIYIQDFGTQQDNMFIFIIATTAFVAFLTLLPEWFLYDEIQGSLKNILTYSFTSRYSQLNIPGLSGNTGLGTLIYGILFVVLSIPKTTNTNDKETFVFIETLQHTVAMILSNRFLTNVTPAFSNQVFSIAILLAMYIISDHIPMSSTTSTFVLWRMSTDVSKWVSTILNGGIFDQILLYSILLCVLPTINRKTASVIFVAAVQTLISNIVRSGSYLGSVGMVVSSTCVLLVADIVLDTRKQRLAHH